MWYNSTTQYAIQLKMDSDTLIENYNKILIKFTRYDTVIAAFHLEFLRISALQDLHTSTR